jgi:hypothetical protein
VSAGVRQTGVRGATETQREREDAGWSEETDEWWYRDREEGGVEEVRLRGGWWWWTRRSLLACLRAYSAADDAATPSLSHSHSLSAAWARCSSVRGSPRLLPLAGSQVGFTSMAAPVIG